MKAGLIRARALGLLAFGAIALAAGVAPASAQSQVAGCEDLNKTWLAFTSQIQQAQALGKAKAGPDKACAVLTKLQATQASLLPMLEKDAAWCHVPPQAIEGVKQQGPQISKVKNDACNAAVKFKQMEAQARKQQQERGPGLMGGGDSIVGGPIKMPQGAL